MYNFGLEITSVFCGTICPELVAQYHRNIHRLVRRGSKSTKRSRLDKNFLLSTGRIVHAIQAAPTHRPALASVSLAKGQR
jgi:hypothetical protein